MQDTSGSHGASTLLLRVGIDSRSMPAALAASPAVPAAADRSSAVLGPAAIAGPTETVCCAHGPASLAASPALPAAADRSSAVLGPVALTVVAVSSVTACFALISCYARPYVEDVEDWADIAGRVFLIATLGVGIALNEGVGPGGRAACRRPGRPACR